MRKSYIILLTLLLTSLYIGLSRIEVGGGLLGFVMLLLATIILYLLFDLIEETYLDSLEGLRIFERGVLEAGREIEVAGIRATKKGVRASVFPIRVLEKEIKTTYDRTIEFIGRFGLVIFITAAVMALPTPDGLSESGHAGIGLFVFTAAVLGLEPVSLPIAALMVPIALIGLGLGDAETAFGPFSRPVVFLILGSMFLAEAVRKHGLARRMAVYTIVMSKGNVKKILFGMMVTAAVLSMWIVNTAATAILIPVALTISHTLQDEEEAKKLLILLAFGISVAASVGGMGTILGASSNAVASGLLNEVMEWTFLDWMKYGLPAAIIVLPLSWAVLLRVIRVETETLDITHILDEKDKMGAMSSNEREVLLVLFIAAFLWVTGSYFEGFLGLPKTFLSSAIVAVIAVSMLSIRNLILWDDIKGVSWGVFLIIGAGLTLGDTLTRSGATQWLSGLFAPYIQELPFILVLSGLITVSALLTNVVNNTTIAAVFVPILLSVSQSQGVSPIRLVIPATLATTFGYSLPSASARMAILASTGLVTREDMLKYGILITIPSVLALIILFYGMTLLGVI
jgi:sodium-dependent dicarboxylate transporter 2/3/5